MRADDSGVRVGAIRCAIAYIGTELWHILVYSGLIRDRQTRFKFKRSQLGWFVVIHFLGNATSPTIIWVTTPRGGIYVIYLEEVSLFLPFGWGRCKHKYVHAKQQYTCTCTVQITFIFKGQTHLVFGKRVCTCVMKHSNAFRTFLNWLKNSKRVWHERKLHIMIGDLWALGGFSFGFGFSFRKSWSTPFER